MATEAMDVRITGDPVMAAVRVLATITGFVLWAPTMAMRCRWSHLRVSAHSLEPEVLVPQTVIMQHGVEPMVRGGFLDGANSQGSSPPEDYSGVGRYPNVEELVVDAMVCFDWGVHNAVQQRAGQRSTCVGPRQVRVVQCQGHFLWQLASTQHCDEGYCTVTVDPTLPCCTSDDSGPGCFSSGGGSCCDGCNACAGRHGLACGDRSVQYCDDHYLGSTWGSTWDSSCDRNC